MRADRTKVAPLLRTARGQLDGVLKMIEDDRYCMAVSYTHLVKPRNTVLPPAA